MHARGGETNVKAEVPLTEGRFSGPIRVPLDVAPGDYDLETECGGTVPFTVLEAGLLSITPDRAEPAGNKYTALATYYFGRHPANRIELSRGRDLKVEPAPASGPINFLAFPLLEVGSEVVKTKNYFSFLRKDGVKKGNEEI